HAGSWNVLYLVVPPPRIPTPFPYTTLFRSTTARAIEKVGGAGRGKAIIILSPVDPPMIMRDTVSCAIPSDADTAAIAESIEKMVAEVAAYVPGYTLRAEPQFDGPRDIWNGMARVAVFLEVRGNGDYLP